MYNQGTQYNTTIAIYLTKQITITCMPRLHHTLHSPTLVQMSVTKSIRRIPGSTGVPGRSLAPEVIVKGNRQSH